MLSALYSFISEVSSLCYKWEQQGKQIWVLTILIRSILNGYKGGNQPNTTCQDWLVNTIAEPFAGKTKNTHKSMRLHPQRPVEEICFEVFYKMFRYCVIIASHHLHSVDACLRVCVESAIKQPTTLLRHGWTVLLVWLTDKLSKHISENIIHCSIVHYGLCIFHDFCLFIFPERAPGAGEYAWFISWLDR